MRNSIPLVALVLFSTTALGQQKDHPGYPPTIFLASASEVDGKVIIQLSRPGPVTPPVDGKADAKPGDRVELEWVPLRKVTLGETVHAFGVDGKELDAKAVLKALVKPVGAAVFLRNYTSDPVTPAPFYLALFRDGTVVLTLRPEDILNAKPGQ